MNLIADKSLICYPPADMFRTIPIMLLCLSTAGCFGPDNAFRAPIEYPHYWLVTGEILDAQTNEPVVEADVVVTLLRGGEQIGEESTRTDPTGRFGVISDQGRTFRIFDLFGGSPPEPIGPPPDVILLRIVTANGEITEMIAVSEEMIRSNTALGVTISGTISLPP